MVSSPPSTWENPLLSHCSGEKQETVCVQPDPPINDRIPFPFLTIKQCVTQVPDPFRERKNCNPGGDVGLSKTYDTNSQSQNPQAY